MILIGDQLVILAYSCVVINRYGFRAQRWNDESPLVLMALLVITVSIGSNVTVFVAITLRSLNHHRVEAARTEWIHIEIVEDFHFSLDSRPVFRTSR